MKRLVLVLSFALAMTANAKLEKVLDITLANQQSLVNAATKIGGFVGEPMLGMMPAGLFAVNPLAMQGLGPARADGKFYGALYVDGLDASCDIMQLAASDKVKGALLYPVSLSKADFLAETPEAKEVNGVITWNKMFVVFSADGKYASVANDAAAAQAIFAGVAKIPSLKKDEAVRLRMFKAGMKIAVKVLESDDEIPPQCIEIYKTIDKVEFSLCAGSYGVELRGSVDCTADSLLSKLGNKTLSSDTPLAFAGKDALVAVAYAADASSLDLDAEWKKLMTLADKWGITTNWISYEKKGFNAKIVLNPTALAAYIKGEGKEKFKELDSKSDEVVADIMSLSMFKPIIEVHTPEQACAFYMKGAKVPLDAQMRFEKVLPKFSRKSCASVGVFSAYGIIKSCNEVVCQLLGKDDAGEAKSFLAKLPSADSSAIAFVWMKKGLTTQDYVVRANPAEIKNLYILCQMLQAENQGKSAAVSKAIDDAN